MRGEGGNGKEKENACGKCGDLTAVPGADISQEDSIYI